MWRSRDAKEQASRARRAVALYDSVTVLPGGKPRQQQQQVDTIDTEEREEERGRMPGEPHGKMSKSMSYEVNPIYSV